MLCRKLICFLTAIWDCCALCNASSKTPPEVAHRVVHHPDRAFINCLGLELLGQCNPIGQLRCLRSGQVLLLQQSLQHA